MRRFFYPSEGIARPIDWMCCSTAQILKTKQEEIMEPNNKTPVYYETAAYARENGELELFRLSHRTNIACKNDIQTAISRHFDGMRLDKETAKGTRPVWCRARLHRACGNCAVQILGWPLFFFQQGLGILCASAGRTVGKRL